MTLNKQNHGPERNAAMTTDNDILVRDMKFEEFEAIKRGNGPRGTQTEQQRLIWHMKAGEAYVLLHKAYNCNRGTKDRKTCQFASMVASIRKSSGRKIFARHMPDGNVAVARYRDDVTLKKAS